MKKQKINEEITASELILIDENGKNLGQVSYDQAMLLAYEKGLDLVEVGSNNNPPIAKIMDFGKELYKEQKQISKQKAKQKGTELKEIKLSLRIEPHDFQTKVDRAKKFLQEGNKVKVFLQLMGREMAFKDQAYEIINKFTLDSNADFEQQTKRMGNRFFALLKKKK